MPIKWSESLSVGVEIIDRQHRELIERIGEFQKACQEGKGVEKLEELYAFIVRYVEEHFRTEEELMARYGYDLAHEHTQKHQWFKKEFDSLKERLNALKGASNIAEGLSLVMETASLLTDWFINHIGNMDKKLGEFLRKKGVS